MMPLTLPTSRMAGRRRGPALPQWRWRKPRRLSHVLVLNLTTAQSYQGALKQQQPWSPTGDPNRAESPWSVTGPGQPQSRHRLPSLGTENGAPQVRGSSARGRGRGEAGLDLEHLRLSRVSSQAPRRAALKFSLGTPRRRKGRWWGSGDVGPTDASLPAPCCHGVFKPPFPG